MTPDLAVVMLGVQTDADTAGKALTQNNDQMQSVLTALRNAGIANTDIRTTAVQLYPRYNPNPTEAQTNQVVGYTASNTVEVIVRGMDNLGSVLDDTVKAGGNQIQGIRFDISDSTSAMDDAREAAMADATRKGQQLAGLANGSLGAVVSIVENSNEPIPFAGGARQAIDSAVPISPGQQTVTVTIQVTWELR